MKRSNSLPISKPYKVFISSTYLDNIERRKLVANAITMAEMVWHGMELFTASTQPTVEECIRFAKEADVLVGIIAWRYGWEPDNVKSITEMEYDACPNRLMFLIDPKLLINLEKDTDSEPDKWKKQEKLEAFKSRIAQDQQPAYFHETDLQAKVLRALQQWREKITEHSNAKKLTQPQKEKEQIYQTNWLSYHKKIEALYKSLTPSGLSTIEKTRINLDDIYIPLRAITNLEKTQDINLANKNLKIKKYFREDITFEKAFYISSELEKQGFILIGEPGSGKTTHLIRALLFCLKFGSESFNLPLGLFPILLKLRDFENPDLGLKYYINRMLSSPRINADETFIGHLILKGKFLLLLDGLDEIEDIERRDKIANLVIKSRSIFPNSIFVTTCRYAGYSEKFKLYENFLELQILPFNEEEANNFIYNWYYAVEKNVSRAKEISKTSAYEKATDLIKRLKKPEFRSRRVFELTRNPLLLTNICLVHRYKGSLPKNRARLYKECIDILLEQWRLAKGLPVSIEAESSRKILQPIAYWLHGVENRTVATKEEYLTIIGKNLKKIKWENGNSLDFFRTIEEEIGIIHLKDDGTYGFMHLCFQEYLAAREIRLNYFSNPEILSHLANNMNKSWWKEVGLLLLALEDEPHLFTPFITEILKQQNLPDNFNMIEQCLDESIIISHEPFLDFVRNQNPNYKKNLEIQYFALRVLRRVFPSYIDELRQFILNHPFKKIVRWGEGVLKDQSEKGLLIEKIKYEMIRINGGEYLIGSDKSEYGHYDDEMPQSNITIDTFFIGKYPVTNEQYGIYLVQNQNVKEPKYWADREYNQPNLPVVGISWNEARNYAKWAGLRLPSEAEWEYACRAGSESKHYFGTTGEDLERAAWFRKNSGGKLHAIGEKEPNNFGLYDMLGNVWEWVEDHYHSSYKDRPSDAAPWVDKYRGHSRVYRGGGWNSNSQNCRSAVRGNGSPNRLSEFDLGFRLAKMA